MIIDSSALVATVFKEPGSDVLVDAVLNDTAPLMSAANALEAAIVVDARQDAVISRRLDEIRRQLGIAIAPVTAEHVDIARRAYHDFGKGSGHPAQLNFGDCFAYALATEHGQPLLFVGDDFSETDIEPALSSSDD